MSFDAEVGGRGSERQSLLGQIAGAPALELIGPDERVLEALGLVSGEVGRIGVGGAHVYGERTVPAGCLAQIRRLGRGAGRRPRTRVSLS